MMGTKSVFVDANILLYSTNPKSQFYKATTKALAETQEKRIERVISTQILREFYAFASLPGENGHQVDTKPILDIIKIFRQSYRVLDDNGFVSSQLFDNLAINTYIGGRQIHDANIVATMHTYKINHLLTNNTKHFQRFEDEITIIPLTDFI